MFDIGFAEILLVAVVALVVLGPEKFPVAVKTLGLWFGRAKRAVTSIQSEISEEIRLDEMRRTVAIEKAQLEKELQDMQRPFHQAIDQGEQADNDSLRDSEHDTDTANESGKHS